MHMSAYYACTSARIHEMFSFFLICKYFYELYLSDCAIHKSIDGWFVERTVGGSTKG